MNGEQEGTSRWTLDAPENGQFWRFYGKLEELERAVVQAALTHVLEVNCRLTPFSVTTGHPVRQTHYLPG